MTSRIVNFDMETARIRPILHARSVDILREMVKTGDSTGLLAAVAQETQELVDSAIERGDPRGIGTMAGIAFMAREDVYDAPMRGDLS